MFSFVFFTPQGTLNVYIYHCPVPSGTVNFPCSTCVKPFLQGFYEEVKQLLVKYPFTSPECRFTPLVQWMPAKRIACLAHLIFDSTAHARARRSLKLRRHFHSLEFFYAEGVSVFLVTSSSLPIFPLPFVVLYLVFISVGIQA